MLRLLIGYIFSVKLDTTAPDVLRVDLDNCAF